MRESYQRQDAKAMGRPDMPTPNGPGPTRRQFLARAAILAATAPTLGAFLAACSKSGPSSSAPSLTLAAPDNPVKWNIADDNKPIADGLAPEKGATLKIYNYADYLSPQAVKGFEDKYGDQDRDFDLQRRRRGDHQAPQRGRLRHLQRQLHRDQPPGQRRADPAAEPLATYPTSRTCGRTSPTPGTTRSGGTPCRTPSTPPASAGGPIRCPPTSAR